MKHNSEWKQKQMFMGNSLESLAEEQKGKGGKSPGVGQRDMGQKCEIRLYLILFCVFFFLFL